MYVLRNNETGKYVTPPGQEHSYTAKLEEARVYATEEQAERDRCIESESIVKIHDILRQ